MRTWVRVRVRVRAWAWLRTRVEGMDMGKGVGEGEIVGQGVGQGAGERKDVGKCVSAADRNPGRHGAMRSSWYRARRSVVSWLAQGWVLAWG